jgi:hypothetical protein
MSATSALSRSRDQPFASRGDPRIVAGQHDRHPVFLGSLAGRAGISAAVAESALPVGSPASSSDGVLT